MTQDKKGSPDGIQVIDYEKGKVYDLPIELAEPWIARKLAVAVKSADPDKGQPESKEKKEGEK
ncbi:unnamed protein product [marine sediment metagenome]|uniref:Uncharacterized protein n=1 Tax=marine sediment metagenome TaxID=412755 RepID=X1TFY1_9ZZZZ